MLQKTEDKATEEVDVVVEAEDIEEDLKAVGNVEIGEISQQIRLNATTVAFIQFSIQKKNRSVKPNTL